MTSQITLYERNLSINISEPTPPIELKDGYNQLFLALIITSSLAMSAMDVIEPTLGADQVS